jgi:hypothetical protein
MLLYHVGRAKGNEPSSSHEQDSKIIESAKERHEKIRYKIDRAEYVEHDGDEQRLGAQRHTAVMKKSPIQPHERRKVP